jgi:hypothetical protein
MGWVFKDPILKRPRGGWVFEQYGVTIEQSTLDELVNSVAKMRKAIGDPEGDVEGDIAARIAQSDPYLCRYKKDSLIDSKPVTKCFRSILEQWLLDIGKLEIKNAGLYDARKRAEKCSMCPMRIEPPDKELEVPGEVASRYRRMMMISSGGYGDRVDTAGACKLFQHDNRVAAWKGNPFVGAMCCGENKDKVPSGCWMI